jgi:hypothetical protein
MMDAKISRLSDVCGGKVDIDFRELLAKCIENINDMAYNPAAVRKINFTVQLYPDPATKTVTLTMESSCTLPKKGVRKTMVYIGKGQDGQMGLFTEDPDQVNMFKQLAAGQKREA